MSELKSEEDSEKSQVKSLLGADNAKEVDVIDQATLKKVLESCQRNGRNGFEQLHPIPIEEMGIVTDQVIKCHLFCDQEKLRSSLKYALANRINPDVRVVVRDYVFPCHMLVLKSTSEYFKDYTSASTIYINSDEVTVHGFEQVYDWMVKIDGTPDREGMIEAYVAARYLKVTCLLNQLWYCFQTDPFFTGAEAFELYLDAVPYKTSTLQQLILTRIGHFFMSAVSTEEFLDLKPESVYDMLNCSIVCVNSEMEIFMSAFRWLVYKWDERKEHIETLMKAVRFTLMPPWYILSLKSKQSLPELNEVLEHPFVKEAINAGLSYSVTQHFIGEDSALQDPLKMNCVAQRDWIIDELAPHHHLYKCPNWQYLNYELFNVYMSQVINAGSQFQKTLKSYNPNNLMPCCQKVIDVGKKPSDM